ncbi:MAG TPA: cation transporter [Syntrophomonadaceae bacterium]|nr:cation transporter [Syntrophomonadaceae bacterium]
MAQLSVLSNTLLVLFKLVVGIAINSVSVISEAIHSGLDLLAALLALFAVRQSGKPPDEQHQYGHGKIENISGVIEAILIFIAAIWIIREAVHKLLVGARVETPVWGLIVMAFSGVVNYVISTMLMKTAKATDSVALEADAWHLRTDVYTSLGVAAGLILLLLTGYQILDPLIAIAVALLIIKASFDLTVKAFFPLIDTSLPSDEEEIIKQIIDDYGSQYISFHKLRTRKAGSERHIDLHLVVPETRTIAVSHELCDDIEKAVKDRFPGSHVLIHVEPCRNGDDCLTCPEPCDSYSGKG